MLPDDVAPFGVAPPPAPAGAFVFPEVPPPPVFPPPEVPPPEVPSDEPPLEEPDDEPPLPDDADDDDGEELDEVVVVPVVLVVVAPVVAGAALMVAVGTVSGGVPDVSVAAEPLPHAATAAATAAPAASAATMRELRTTAERPGTSGTSDLEWIHPPAAMRTVVEVLLAVLVAPVAEAQVLNGPRQLGRGRREGQKLTDDLERLPGLAVDVGPPGVGFDHDLTTRGWRPKTVPLTRPHPSPSYSRERTLAPSPAGRRGRVGGGAGWRGGGAAVARVGVAGMARGCRGCGAAVARRWRAGGPVVARGSQARPRTARHRARTQPPDLRADGLDRVPPLKVWPSRWDASPR